MYRWTPETVTMEDGHKVTLNSWQKVPLSRSLRKRVNGKKKED